MLLVTPFSKSYVFTLLIYHESPIGFHGIWLSHRWAQPRRFCSMIVGPKRLGKAKGLFKCTNTSRHGSGGGNLARKPARFLKSSQFQRVLLLHVQSLAHASKEVVRRHSSLVCREIGNIVRTGHNLYVGLVKDAIQRLLQHLVAIEQQHTRELSRFLDAHLGFDVPPTGVPRRDPV